MLLDSSAWIRHLHRGDEVVDRFLGMRAILGHPAVAAEVMLGCGDACHALACDILELPWPHAVPVQDAIRSLDALRLRCRRIGWQDAQVLLDCRASGVPVAIYTLDRRMRDAARGLGVPVIDPPDSGK